MCFAFRRLNDTSSYYPSTSPTPQIRVFWGRRGAGVRSKKLNEGLRQSKPNLFKQFLLGPPAKTERLISRWRLSITGRHSFCPFVIVGVAKAERIELDVSGWLPFEQSET